MPNGLSPRDLVSRPDKMDENTTHIYINQFMVKKTCFLNMRKLRRSVTLQLIIAFVFC